MLLANIEDPNEMPYNVALHQGLSTRFAKKIMMFKEIYAILYRNYNLYQQWPIPNLVQPNLHAWDCRNSFELSIVRMIEIGFFSYMLKCFHSTSFMQLQLGIWVKL